MNLEIQQYNYWEHFKREKELSLILPVNHPQRIELRKVMEELLIQINNEKTKIC